VNNLADKKEHHKDEIDEESFSVKKPHLTSFIAQHQQSSNATQEQKENRKQQNDFENDFDELMNSASN
jgi:hypothetical protein